MGSAVSGERGGDWLHPGEREDKPCPDTQGSFLIGLAQPALSSLNESEGYYINLAHAGICAWGVHCTDSLVSVSYKSYSMQGSPSWMHVIQ